MLLLLLLSLHGLCLDVLDNPRELLKFRHAGRLVAILGLELLPPLEISLDFFSGGLARHVLERSWWVVVATIEECVWGWTRVVDERKSAIWWDLVDFFRVEIGSEKCFGIMGELFWVFFLGVCFWLFVDGSWLVVHSSSRKV